MANPKQSKHYEPSDPPIKPVVSVGIAFAITFLAMAGIGAAIMIGFASFDTVDAAHDDLGAQWTAQSTPQLVERPGLFLEELRAIEDAKLHSYGWVNRSKGIASIPIDRAMDLVLDRLPARAAPPAPARLAPLSGAGVPTTLPPDEASALDVTQPPAGAPGAGSTTDATGAPGAAPTADADATPEGDSEAPN